MSAICSGLVLLINAVFVILLSGHRELIGKQSPSTRNSNVDTVSVMTKNEIKCEMNFGNS